MHLKIFLTLLVFVQASFLCSEEQNSATLLAPVKLARSVFLQKSTLATLKADPDVPQQYRLTLRGVSPHVTYLQDQNHHAAVLGLKQFLEFWKETQNSQQKPYIEANLSFRPTLLSELKSTKFHLSEPIYRASTNTLEFTATLPDKGTPTIGRFKNAILISGGFESINHQLKSEYQTNGQAQAPDSLP